MQELKNKNIIPFILSNIVRAKGLILTSVSSGEVLLVNLLTRFDC